MYLLQGRIRSIYEELSKKLNAWKTANHLYQRGALNTREFEEIQRLSSDQPTKAAEQMLDYLLSQNEDFYNCFLDALTKTEQLHVRQWIVLEGLFILLKLYINLFCIIQPPAAATPAHVVCYTFHITFWFTAK